MILRVSTLALLAILLLASCDDVRRRNSRGPIALGDPSTIVNETDTLYLQDMVPDPAFDEPAAPSASRVTATTSVPRDTTPSANISTLPAGLTADFGNVQIILPGATARDAGRSLRGAKSAAYSLAGTSLGSKIIAVRGGTVKRIQQRTGYSAAVDIAGKPVLLSDLGTQYTGWQTLQGKGGQYTLAPAAPPAFKASPAALRTAVQKAARAKRLDRKAEQKLLTSARSMTTAPLSVVPRVYTWKIEGSGADGKAFTKEVRVDVPL